VQYETEEQQVEAMKEWWAENGRAVMLGIAIGVLIIGAWMFYKSHTEKKAVAASDTFSESLEAIEAGDHAKVIELFSIAKDDHSGSIYGAYTGLVAARASIESGNLEEASSALSWVADNSALDDVGVIAKIRLARVKGALGEAESGLKALPSSYPESFTALVEEARGDLHVIAGNDADAKVAYQKAIDADNAADKNALQMKFNELAAVSAKS